MAQEKITGNSIMSSLRPTINNANNWIGTNMWKSGGYNLFNSNNSAAIGATFGGGVAQEATQSAVQSAKTNESKK
jgi:hypothetical protein